MSKLLPCCSGLLGLALLGLAPAAEEDPKPFPDMAPTVGTILQSEYYDPSRFKPEVMLRHGLRSLEASEISVNTTLNGQELKLDFGKPKDGQQEVMRLPPLATLDDTMRVFENIRMILPKGGFDPQRTRDLVYSMLNGALHSLDPHTVILPPKPADDFAEEIKGEFFGIGAYLSQENGELRIERVMPGMPADKAEVRDGDIILKINGEKTVGLGLPQAVKRIKGPKGTQVVLTMQRAGHDEPFDISIVRDLVPFITMRSYLHEGRIGYVRMDEFNYHTARDLLHAIGRLRRDAGGDIRGFVLDLRFNSGGLLQQARLISDFFLPMHKEIVRTVSLGKKEQLLMSNKRLIMEVPMLVLTGPNSASAAEILSGALQLNNQAAVIGRSTFGKGSVQIVRTLTDGSNLKYTTQEYQLSGGASIQGGGVIPDIELRNNNVLEDGSVDLLPYSYRKEMDNEFALAGHGTYNQESVMHLYWLRRYRTMDQMRAHGLSAKVFTPDQQATLAIELFDEALEGEDTVAEAREALRNGKGRAFVIERMRAPVAKRQQVENKALAEALAGMKHPVTWGDANEPKADALQLRYTGPGALTAGQKTEMTFVLKNTGDAAVGRLYGLIKADNSSPFWEDEIIFGEVPAGGETSGRLEFHVPPRIFNGEERFTVEVFQAGRKGAVASLPVQLAMKAQARPQFNYQLSLVKEEQADGIIEPDEEVTLSLRLTNAGDGDSVKTMLYVFKDDDHFLQLGEGRFELDPIPAGKTVECLVPIKVLSKVSNSRMVKRFKAEHITLQIRAEERFPDDVDRRYRSTMFHAPKIAVGKAFTDIDIKQPKLAIAQVDKTEEAATVTLQVSDDNLRYLSLFQGDDKIDLQRAAQIVDGTHTVQIQLEPGLNNIRALANDADDVSEYVSLRMWGPAAKQASDATAAVVQGDSNKDDDELEAIP